MIELFSVFVLLLSLAIAGSSSVIQNVLLASLMSLMLCILYVLMDAPDVAMTEASIGSCISTIITLNLLQFVPNKITTKKSRILPFLMCFVLAIILMYMGWDFYPYGSEEGAVHSHLGRYFIHNTEKDIGIPSFVTSILASYRGYDTFGETAVIVIASIGVYIISFLDNDANSNVSIAPGSSGILDSKRANIIMYSITRFIAPFTMLFAIYIQLFGEFGPGGAFQAGAIFGTMIIAISLFRSSLVKVENYIMYAGAGLLLYGLVGVLCSMLGGAFLEYSILSLNPVLGQKIGIFVIELGVGISVSAAIILIYHSLAKTL
jgi:multicomponent Na+:H+ antiporter subunit B